ncbi:acetyl-CoA synthetase-like protein [Xylariaceae sp. FL0804]|nr:acetyl-CoA synthetase-like protein [Xylariaceae sp. FL0804]
MPVPLAVSVPAAAAGLAYLNAKTGLWYDWQLLRGLIPASIANSSRQSKGQSNAFYRLEQVATKKSSADRNYILFQDRTWTFAQVYEAALKYGNYLRSEYGIKPRDIVAMDMPNSDHFMLLIFGLWSIGAKPALINYNLTGEALSHCVSTARATMMLVDPDVAHNVDENVRQRLGGLRIEVLKSELITKVLATKPVRPPDELRADQQPRDMAMLIFTSGTTGLPKAAVVAWSKLILGGLFASRWLALRTSDTFYTAMPMYHSSASVLGFYQCLEGECTFAIGRKFSTKKFWKEVRQYNATIIQYVGETCRYLLSAPPEIDPTTGANLDKEHRVRLAFGNGLRPDVWERFRERFGIADIAEFYAATEGFVGAWNYTRNHFASGAIGRNGLVTGTLQDRRIAIVARDPDTDAPWRDPATGLCRPVARGGGGDGVGELLFRLPADAERDFQGYYNNPRATAGKVVRDVRRRGDAYFRSGDLVSLDREWRMHFHDRIGDTFRWKSENVATTEVGAAVGAHPAVAEANVYGVLLPHHDGRAGCAAVALRHHSGGGGGGGDPGVGDPNNKPDAALLRSLAEHAAARLPRYAVPLFLRAGPGLAAAVTGTNKQQKHELRVQGVDPAKVGEDRLFWLRGGTYVEFGQEDWDRLSAGQVKL